MAIAVDAYAPFATGAGANATEEMWRRFMRHMLSPGVIPGAGQELQVYADSSGLQVKVRPGEVWLRGHWGEVTEEKVLALVPNGSGLQRLDRVVIRADFQADLIELDVHTGTPGVTTPPPVTQDSGRWEVSLAVITVAPGAVSIAPGDVTDDRIYATAYGGVHPVAANGSRPTTGLPTGAWGWGDNALQTWDQTGLWVPRVPAGPGYEVWAYQAGTAQVIPPGVDTRVRYDTVVHTSDLVAISTHPTDGGTIFELLAGGRWFVGFGVTYEPGVDDTERFLSISEADTLQPRYIGDSGPSNTATAPLPINLSCCIVRRFAAGTRLCAVTYHQDAGSLSLSLVHGQTVSASIAYLGR